MTSHLQAQQLLRQGRVNEAERVLEEQVAVVPDDAHALNMLAVIALQRREAGRALQLAQRAVRSNPDEPIAQHTLGLASEMSGDLHAAQRAHQSAIEAAPEFHLARLHLAQVLEKNGRLDDAVIHYARALQDAQAKGRWENADTTPPGLRPEVEYAVKFVREHRRATFWKLFSPLVAQYGAASLTRVHRCLRIHLLEEAPVFADSRQQPMFLYFPELPTSAYLDRSAFEWIESLEADQDAIRGELLDLLPSSSGRERVFTSEELERENLRGQQLAPSWNGYYFHRHGERRDNNCEACPATAAALDRLPLCRIREHGPEVLFSVFTPGTHLLPHRGVTNVRAVAHLPLIVPRDCVLTVGQEEHVWQPGKVVVFDDTFEHEAWNRSDEIRVVLIFDVWNPYLTEVERLAMQELIPEIGDFSKAVKAA